jgi:hypothetical protein
LAIVIGGCPNELESRQILFLHHSIEIAMDDSRTPVVRDNAHEEFPK